MFSSHRHRSPVTPIVRRPGRHRRVLELEHLPERVVLSATIYTVDLTTDSGPTSAGSGSGTTGDLRYVINQANANPNTDGSIIQFDPTVFAAPQTITVSASLGYLPLNETSGTEAIDGPAAGLTVSGGGAGGVFAVNPNANLNVTAAIAGLTITGGSFEEGGGVLNHGTLTLTDCSISENSAQYGGGICNFTTLTLIDCNVSGNSSTGQGGGICNQGGPVTLTGCTLSENSTAGPGGGLNTYGTMTLTGCTISGNTAKTGGGLDSGYKPDLTIIGCTVVGNSATAAGGGLNNDVGTPTLVDTIVAGNTVGSSPSDIGGPGASGVTGTNNLIGTGGSGGITGGADGNVVLTDLSTLGLAPLGNYGGPTQTMALLPGSAAIGAGTAAGGVTADQRGLPLHAPTPDIGAFQTNPLVVNTTVDGLGSPAGDLSLRQAVNLADALGGSQTITFDATVFASARTITLVDGQLELSGTGGTETITGPAAGLTVSGGGKDRVFQVDKGVTASINGLTITGGSAGGNGGGIANDGTATLTDCTVSDNSAQSNGGGIYNDGTATLTDCTVSDNSAGFFDGGGIFNDGTATLTDCTVSDNSTGNGGGIYNYGTATLSLTDCTVSDNSAGNGGGIYNYGRATLTDCTVSANSAGHYGGGIDNYGTATLSLTDSTASANSAGENGGGIYNRGTATLSLTDSTVSANSVEFDGGGIFNDGTATLTDSTVSGNSTGQYGGGIDNDGTATLSLTDSTVSDNSAGNGGGIYNDGTATLTDSTVSANSAGGKGGGIFSFSAVSVTTTLANTIVAGNAAGTGPDVDGPVTSRGHNLVGEVNGSSGWVGTDLTGTAAQPLDAKLAPLGDYGGPTRTMALLPGSAALAAGSAAGGVTADQRGLPLHAPTPDIGAFQTNPLVVNTTADGLGSPAGDLSLRQAVNLADALGGSQTITFDATVFASARTITLVDGQLELSGTGGTQTITGPAAGLTVSGGGKTRVFQVDKGVSASISGLTITGGSASTDGGGIENDGTATLTDCTISANSAGNQGGGIFNNSGTINSSGATLSLTDCTVSANSAMYGGGIFNFGTATLSLTDCTVSGNSAGDDDGGIFNGFAAILTLTDCTVSANSAEFDGGGIYNFGTATLTDCTVSGNSAGHDDGGIANVGAATLTDCTVSGNSTGRDGGGIYNFGTAILTDCTVSGNSAGVQGGGIFSYRADFATTELANTIVAGNAAATGPDVDGPVNSQGHNLVGEVNGSSGWVGTDLTGTAAQPLDAKLAPLGDYGGPTRTMALLPGSPALAAGSAAGGVTADQRGLPLHSPTPDIGAFQTNPLVVNTTADSLGSPAGDLSLRQAVNLVDALGGAQTITFDTTVFASARTITLVDGQLELTGGIQTITGPAAGVTINGGGKGRVFQVDRGVTALISGLTITGGSASTDGGGIENDGTATFTDCTVSANSAQSSGGGVLNTGTATFTDCTVSGNSAGDNNGGIYNRGTATFTDCTVSDNSAGFDVGGIFNGVAAILTLTDCTVSGNSAENDGGGIFNKGGATLTDCTVSDNLAGGYGGGIYNGDTANLTDCTISGNSAGGYGGGIFSYRVDFVSTELANTIVAGNASVNSPDVDGPVTSRGYNLVGEVNGSSGWVGSDLTGTAGQPLDAQLAPLGDYGGPTRTMALLPGSPALAAGSAAGGVTADQRGAPRATSGPVNIGAFQAQGYTLALVSGSPQSTTVRQSFAAPLVVALTEDFAGSPLPGATITFTSPSSGAGATLSTGSAVTGADGRASVTATADATAGTYAAIASAGTGSTTSFRLTNQVTPGFSGLDAQTATYGSTVIFTGTLAAGAQALPAGEDVAVTVNGVTHDAPLAADGSFSARFSRADVVLNSSTTAFTVTYGYAGDGAFLAAHGSSPLTVDPAVLTAAIVGDPTRTYDGTTGATLTPADFSLSGLVGGDRFTVTQRAGTYNGKDVTTTTAVTTTLAAADFVPGPGSLAGNYTFPAAASGAGSITPAPLTITAMDVTIPFGGAVPTLTATYAGLVGRETPANLAAPVQLSTTATNNVPAGTYPIVAGGASSSNYAIRYVDGTLSVAEYVPPARPAAAPAASGYVSTLYHEVLGRGPEPKGLSYWMRRYLHHMPRRAIWQGFATSKERQSLVQQGRTPSIPPGQAYRNALEAERRAGGTAAAIPAGPLAMRGPAAEHRGQGPIAAAAGPARAR